MSARSSGGDVGLAIPQPVNAAGFPVTIQMSPEEADARGLKPFGDGGADNSIARPKLYTHGPCASKAASAYLVNAEGVLQSSPERQHEVAMEALAKLRANGFVVLERLHSAEEVLPLEREAAWFLGSPQDGFIPQPLRAGRTEGHLPFAIPWASNWLMKNNVVLEIAASYLTNGLAAGRTQDEQQWGLVQWLTSGAELDWFLRPEFGPQPGPLLDDPPPGCSDVGAAQDLGAFFGRASIIKTPPGSEAQKHHRDINFPGPMAQLTVQVPLTPLKANNGPLGYVPGSHRMHTPGFEVVANPPIGSVVLYDSFCEHRGIEHHGREDRYALYYEFETRGVYSGYTATHFGPQSGLHMEAFRMAVDTELRKWVDASAKSGQR